MYLPRAKNLLFQSSEILIQIMKYLSLIEKRENLINIYLFKYYLINFYLEGWKAGRVMMCFSGDLHFYFDDFENVRYFIRRLSVARLFFFSII